MRIGSLVIWGPWLGLSACATFINEAEHPMRIDTLRADRTPVAGADCLIRDEGGERHVRSGELILVRRRSKDLDIVCSLDGEAEARGRLISRANAGMAGNILIGGLIGAAIDSGKGTAFTYPTWVRLMFGRSLVFDRRREVDGQALDGVSADDAAAADESTPGTRKAP